MSQISANTKTTLRVRRVLASTLIYPHFSHVQTLVSTISTKKYTKAEMSSPASRRSQRNSLTATPRRAARNSLQPSSPAVAAQEQSQPPQNEAPRHQQSQSPGTPRASQQNIAASSPLFFRSSPVNGAANINGPERMEISSPLRQASSIPDNDGTPRDRAAPPNGELENVISSRHANVCPQIHRLYAMLQARVPHVPWSAGTSSLIYLAAVVGFLCGLRGPRLLVPPGSTTQGVVTSTPMFSAQLQAVDGVYLLTKMVYQYETRSQTRMLLPSRTWPLIHPRRKRLEDLQHGSSGEPTYLYRIPRPLSNPSCSISRKSTGCGLKVLQKKRLQSLGAEPTTGNTWR